MEGLLKDGVCFCNECGNLDFMRGQCNKCGSKNIEFASQDISFDTSAHDHLMKMIYTQHEYAANDKTE